MATPRRQPGDDQPVGSSADLMVIQAIKDAKNQADMAKRVRVLRNRENMNIFLGNQDWRHKQPGQSKESLPKTAAAVEQLSAFIERALIQFGAWYSMDFSSEARQILPPEKARKLLNCFLENLPIGDQKSIDFRTLMGDAMKLGALESLLIFKIHGGTVTERRFFAESGTSRLNGETGRFERVDDEIVAREEESWRLKIDLIPANDYSPDPTGEGLFEIHTSEQDFHVAKQRAEDGIYDIDAINRIEEDFTRQLDRRRRPQERGQQEAVKPGFRRRIVIDEYWGTMLDARGNIVERNVLAAIANDKWLIRPPEPNPWWHGESPFVASPITRVPLSVWHRALFDDASRLNVALSELFSLGLDGGIASVWGTRQLRIDDLQDPRDVSGGIPQGKTLAVKSTLPHNAKVLETVTTGEVPRDFAIMFEVLNREFNQAALTNEIKLGQLPPRQVLATEIVEASQSQAVTLDKLAGNLEMDLLTRTLRKSWLNILQNMDDLSSQRVIDAIGPVATFKLARLGKAKVFSLFANGCSFKVNGLSATLSRVRDFQKMAALFQLIMSNPLLFQAFAKKFSPDKALDAAIRQLNINPETLYLDEDEKAQLQQRMAELPGIAQMIGSGGQGGAGQSAEQTGEPGLPAEINQAGNPLSGMGAEQ